MSRVLVIQNFIIIAYRNLLHRHSKKVKILRNVLRSGIPYIYAGFIFVLFSCAGGGKKTLDETPTRGDIKIFSDESYQPLIETEVFTFTHLYKDAKIKPVYKPEVDIINDFMHDSVKVIVTSKRLTEDQIKWLRDTLIITRTTTFAYDALALVTNLENTDTLLKYETIRDIFQNKITKWKDINPKSKLGDLSVIFDNTKSGNIRYFKEKFKLDSKFPEYCYAVNSNEEVINYVQKNVGAIGIISVNWISDSQDNVSQKFLEKIKITAISDEGNIDGPFLKPYQAYIADGSYPFVREVYLINREYYTGLGTGFVNFVAGEKGQRIILKSGLVPATMPIRLVQIKKD